MTVVRVGLESNPDNRQLSKKNNKYQLLYTYTVRQESNDTECVARQLAML
jgi:hypothetical protein